MASQVLDHVRLCGSLDVYLLKDGLGWYVIEGVELKQSDAIKAKHRIDVPRIYDETEALELFERRVNEG